MVTRGQTPRPPGRSPRRRGRSASDASGPPVDPYLLLARASKFAYLDATDESWFPIIIELAGGVTAQRFASGAWDPPSDWKQWMRVPSIYRFPPVGVRKFRFCTATVRTKFFDRLETDPSLRRTIARTQLGLPTIVNTDLQTEFKELSIERALSDKVLTGIIDDGIAFANERFRDGGADSRVEYFWDQDQRWPAAGGPTYVIGGIPLPKGAQGLGYGRELRRSDIRNLLTLPGELDEQTMYRRCGHLDFVAAPGEDTRIAGHRSVGLRASHGTAVMDIAAGFDPDDPNRGGRPIIAVQLPSDTTADSSGGTLAPHVLDAMWYILNRADQIAIDDGTGALPVVINLSYGMIAGPHDGSSILEAGIDELIRLRNDDGKVPFSVVIPAGNHNLPRCHAHFDLAASPTQTFKWRVVPDDGTPSLMEIWLAYPNAIGVEPKVKVQLVSPAGHSTGLVAEGKSKVVKSSRGDFICSVDNVGHSSLGNRKVVLLSIAPTATQDANHDVAPSGTWKVKIVRDGPFAAGDAWIQRDDTPYGFPTLGRQSRFDDDENYVRFDPQTRELDEDPSANPSYVLRAGTLNAIATAMQAIVVGGFRLSDFKAARYSGTGPVASSPIGVPPVRSSVDPDAAAACEESPACHGVLAAGTQSGSVAAFNGTSVAAPRVARLVADLMSAGVRSDRIAVQVVAFVQEFIRGLTSRLPATRAGFGRIEWPPLPRVKRR